MDTINFTVEIKNIGAGTAGPSTMIFMIGGETFGEEFSIPSLDPGETYTVIRTIVLGVAQDYRNTMVLDVYDDVPELNEDNNTRTYRYTVEEA
jgi:subtilase family serine protease